MGETFHTPNREEQALLEVGQTAISPVVAWILVAGLLVTLAAVPLLDSLASGSVGGPIGGGAEASTPLSQMRELADRLDRVWTLLGEPGLFAANRELLAAINEFEDRLEEQSILRARLLPPVQQQLTAHLGLGNEQAYVGRGGWLNYRPDLDYVTGPGFLDPGQLERRADGGDAWLPPPSPDPLPALVDFDRQLASRGIRLLVVPTPVKPMIHPGTVASGGDETEPPLDNPSFPELVRRLEAAGIEIVDLAPLLAPAGGEPRYLETDTHWTPEAMDRVAEELARRIVRRSELTPRPDPGFQRRPVAVENLGDIAVMLHLPEDQGLFPRQRVTTQRVLGLDGKSWRPDRSAEVLLLGDSFANIYSEPGLGWGNGAGLAEQLAYRLQLPVDRIALNAGGSHATREALRRDLDTGRDRLAGKRVVVYQFAVRELAIGDWKLIDLERPGVREP